MKEIKIFRTCPVRIPFKKLSLLKKACLKTFNFEKRRPAPFPRNRKGRRSTAKRYEGEISIVLVSNREIRRLNRRFLKRDRFTDVIAFKYAFRTPAPKLNVARSISSRSAPDVPSGTLPFGDIFISVDRASKQARELGHPLLKELAILTIHGTLHLLGRNDRTPRQKKRMFSRQETIFSGLAKRSLDNRRKS